MTLSCCGDQVVDWFVSVLSASVRSQTKIDHPNSTAVEATKEHGLLSKSARYQDTLIELATQPAGRK